MQTLLMAVLLLQPSPVSIEEVTGYDQLGAAYAQAVAQEYDATRVAEIGYLLEYMADAFEYEYPPDRQPMQTASETLRDIPVRLEGNETMFTWITVMDREFFHHRVQGQVTNEWEHKPLAQKFRLLVKGIRRWLNQ